MPQGIIFFVIKIAVYFGPIVPFGWLFGPTIYNCLGIINNYSRRDRHANKHKLQLLDWMGLKADSVKIIIVFLLLFNNVFKGRVPKKTANYQHFVDKGGGSPWKLKGQFSLVAKANNLALVSSDSFGRFLVTGFYFAWQFIYWWNIMPLY